MRKTLVMVSLALGSAAMAATWMPADGRHSTVERGKGLPQQAVANDMPTLQSATKVNETPRMIDDPVYEFENIIVGISAFDYQHNGAYGKMIAVGADGVAHGSFMGGANEDTGRRVLAWCVSPDLSIPNPTANVANVRSGYTTYAVTSASSPSLPANTGVVGYHRATASWFAADFGDCSMAFQGLQHLNGPDILWPHVAVDYQDKVHMVCGDASTTTPNTVWYDASTTGSSWDGAYNAVNDDCNTLGHTITACKTAPGVAVLCLPDAPASPEPYEAPGLLISQLHHDVFVWETRDAANNMHAFLDSGVPFNVTKYHSPESTAPFRAGTFAFSDVDAIYDAQDTPTLHIAFTSMVSHMDSMLTVEDDITYYTDFVNYNEHTALWHYNGTTGQWGHISGWLTGDGEADDLPRVFAGVFRTENDRVQLAHDPETGYLYALWSVFNKNDTRDPHSNTTGADSLAMANGELFMACSADNGATWSPRVNITNSPTPGCVAPDCDSENWGSLAEVVDNGYLHISFMMDQHAGSFIRCDDDSDGSDRTVNNYYYMRIPVSAIPPSPVAWNAEGHIGLAEYSRTWGFTAGHPDTMQILDKLHIYNEGTQPRYLVDLILYHDALDVFGDSLSNLWATWEFMDGDPVEPGEWHYKPLNQNHWDGLLEPYRMTLGHVSVGHRGLPLREQAFKLNFNDGSSRVYRIIYQSANFGPSLVEVMDLDNLEQYASTVLYHNSGVAVEQPTTPADYTLQQNVPNPFNPSTSISFQLGTAGTVSLKVYDLNGATVATLVDGPMSAGSHMVNFDGSRLSSGVYFYTLEANGVKETRKMLLTK